MLASARVAREHGGLALLGYRCAILAFPRRVRAELGGDMLNTFASAYASRRRLGDSAARRFAGRAALDAVTAGLGERFGQGGIGPVRGGRRTRARDLVGSLAADVVHALRSLRATPGFTLTVLIVLGLGVGVNGALFAALNAALLADAPYPESYRLVMLDMTVAAPGEAPEDMVWSYPKYQILEARAGLAAESAAAYARRTVTLSGRGAAERLSAEIVTPSYFRVLGLPVAAGRWLANDNSADREVIVSQGLFRDRFGGDPAALGQDLTVNGQTLTLVGVAPPGFRGLTGTADLWIPMSAVPAVISPSLLGNFDGHWLAAVGRLRAGASLAELSEQLESVAREVEETYPWSTPGEEIGGGARWMNEARRNPRTEQAVIVVAAAAGLVLLIACANLASLMLARGVDRRRETAVRMALGGSRLRVARGVVVEVALLSLAGGFLGVLVARQGTAIMARAWPAPLASGGWNLAFIDPAALRLDLSMVLYTFLIAAATGVLFAIGPLLHLTRTDLAGAMREGIKGSAARLGGRRVLVAIEVGLAIILVVGASLMMTTLRGLVTVDTGFNSERLLRFVYALPRSHPMAATPLEFHAQVLDRLAAIPGVEAVTAGTTPLGGHEWTTGVRRAGERTYEAGSRPSIGVNLVAHDYFEVLEIPVLSGRTFEPYENAETPAVAIINTSAARELFPDSDPIGQPLAIGVSLTSDGATAEIVGVVGDVLYESPAEGHMAEAYVLFRQEPGRDLTPMLRTSGDWRAVLPAVRTVMAELDPDLPIFGVSAVEELLTERIGDTRVLTGLLALFATLALLLAATGVWGVMAYSVSGRARELGIRMALGARGSSVVALVVRQGLGSVAIGAASGVAVAYLGAGLLRGFLFGIEPTEPTAFVGSVALLIATGWLAAYLPARRASRLDPVDTLRAD